MYKNRLYLSHQPEIVGSGREVILLSHFFWQQPQNATIAYFAIVQKAGNPLSLTKII